VWSSEVEVVFGYGAEGVLLVVGDGIQWVSEAGPAPQLYLDEDERLGSKYTNTRYTRVDVSCPTHSRRCPALRAGKNLAIRHPNLCTLRHVLAAVLGIVGDRIETIGLTAGTY
jgi:hypothetical protein